MDSTQTKPNLLKNNRFAKKLPFWDKLKEFFGEYGYLFVTALIPAVLFYLLYLLSRGLYPFGDGTVLVLDLTGQYVSFYEGLHDILRGEADLLYSFSRNLGGEFLGIYDYYVASPFAMLLALFPERFMLEALLLLFMFKSSLCAFFMGLYLHKHSDGAPKKLVVSTFAIMYAMCSYCVVQQHNSMWIDAVLWLPMLALGIESVIKYGKFRLYVFALAITIHSNFYIGYMVVIFTFAYCFYYYFAHNRNNENNPLGEKNHFIKSVLRMLGWSILAVGIAALAILSARYALSFGKDEFSNPSWDIAQKFDLFEFLYKFLPSSYDTVRPQGLPIVYSGILTIMMAPAFFLCKKFSTREKIAAALFILFFVGSFATSSLDLIWHGFQKPNWLNYRYSFMLCFFLIFLAYRAFDHIAYTSKKALLGVVVVIGGYALILQKFTEMLVEENEKLVIRPFATIWLTLGCLFVYFILACVMGKVKPRHKETVAVIMLVVVCVEMFLSGMSDFDAFNKDVSFSTYSRYNNMIDTMRPISYKVQDYDDGFYRMEMTYHRKTNDNFALKMKGLSGSTSTLNRDTIDFLRSMGYPSRSHWSSYNCGVTGHDAGTPVNDSLLGIKYLITNDNESYYYGDPIFTPADYDYDKDFNPSGQYSVYLNPYALSMAYGVADGWLDYHYDEGKDDYKTESKTPYDRLNEMITVMLGEAETVEVFKTAVQNGDPSVENIKVGSADGHNAYYVEDKGQAATLTYHYTVPANTEVYVFFPNRYLREVKLSVCETKNGTYSKEQSFGGGETNSIVSLGESSSGELYIKAKIKNDNNNFYVLPADSYVYYIDMEVFKDAMARLAKTQFIIDPSSTDSHLTGTVTTDVDRQLMFTSIPFDEGGNIYVDGEKVETMEANDSLVAFYVDGAGEHSIEMKYMPKTVALGIIVSLTCLGIFILILLLYPFVKNQLFVRNVIMISGQPQPRIATDEYMADIEAGDIGSAKDSFEPTVIYDKPKDTKKGKKSESPQNDKKNKK